MADIIGKVLDKAKTDSFQFVSKKPFKAKFVEVKIDHIPPDAKIVGEITEKEAINPYFERPADIRYVKDKDEGVMPEVCMFRKLIFWLWLIMECELKFHSRHYRDRMCSRLKNLTLDLL